MTTGDQSLARCASDYLLPNKTMQAASVDLLFVKNGQEELLSKFLGVTQSTGVLTVGEYKSFSDYGGIINFVKEADKIRFEINLDEAERGGLKLRAQLLNLAKNVRRKKELHSRELLPIPQKLIEACHAVPADIIFSPDKRQPEQILWLM